MPGTPDYCPTVARTARVQQAEQYDCAQHLADLEVEFGAEVLQRSAVWLTIKESRASFAIEHEEQQVDRVRRFAAAMEQRCGRHDDPLSQSALQALQLHILGPRADSPPVCAAHRCLWVKLTGSPKWSITLRPNGKTCRHCCQVCAILRCAPPVPVPWCARAFYRLASNT